MRRNFHSMFEGFSGFGMHFYVFSWSIVMSINKELSGNHIQHYLSYVSLAIVCSINRWILGCLGKFPKITCSRSPFEAGKDYWDKRYQARSIREPVGAWSGAVLKRAKGETFETCKRNKTTSWDSELVRYRYFKPSSQTNPDQQVSCTLGAPWAQNEIGNTYDWLGVLDRCFQLGHLMFDDLYILWYML